MKRKPSRLLVRIAIGLAFAAAAILLSTQFLYRPWRIVGQSMSPILEPGDTVWIELAAARRRAIQPGDVVLLHGPTIDRRPLVKRVVRTADSREHRPELWDDLGGGSPRWFWVEGAQLAASVDSRSFGAVPSSQIVGRVVFRSRPWRRAGRISVSN